MGNKFVITKLEVDKRRNKATGSCTKSIVFYSAESAATSLHDIILLKPIHFIVYEICYQYVVTVPLKTLHSPFHIVLRPIDVVVTDETVILLEFRFVQECISAILLKILLTQCHMQLVLVKLLQLFWNLFILVQPQIEVVTLWHQPLHALKHPFLPIWKRCHQN